jgi:hypothetical protein
MARRRGGFWKDVTPVAAFLGLGIGVYLLFTGGGGLGRLGRAGGVGAYLPRR